MRDLITWRKMVAENERLKSEIRNMGFVNEALHKACSDLTLEILELKLEVETSRAIISFSN